MSERWSTNRPRARRNEASAGRGSERARRTSSEPKRRSGGQGSTGKTQSAGKAHSTGKAQSAGKTRSAGQTRQGTGRQQNASRPAASRRPSWRSHSGGAFKLSSTRRAAVLAILVCAMALSVAVPLRTYWDQRTELAAQEEQRTEIVQQVKLQEQRRSELSDPAYLEPEVRSRTGWAPPGERPFIVSPPVAPPPPPPGGPAAGDDSDAPWYQRLWNSVSGQGE